MSAISNQPSSINFLSPLGFQMNFWRTPDTNFFCQQAEIPGINLPPAPIPSPFVTLPMWGDHIQFSDYTLTFKVDENLQNYLEIFNWMVSLAKTRVYTQEGLAKDAVSDGSLMILSSAREPVMRVDFTDMWPMALSGLKFDATDADVNYITATATFAYRDFAFTSVGQAP